MFSHWSDLQKYEVQWQDHNDRRGTEASNNCTENMGKGVWTNANKTHEVRTSTTLSSVFGRYGSLTSTAHECWGINSQSDNILDYNLFKPSHV